MGYDFEAGYCGSVGWRLVLSLRFESTGVAWSLVEVFINAFMYYIYNHLVLLGFIVNSK